MTIIPTIPLTRQNNIKKGKRILNVRDFLRENNILLFDGAMGTYFNELTEVSGKCELANLTNPQIIKDIHTAYIDAGCNAIKTNTFSANTISLECDVERVKSVIKAGWEIALESAGENFVFADIGPVPYADGTDLEAEYKMIVDTFLELGAKNFIFETFSSEKYPIMMTEYIKSKKPDSFVITEFAVSPDGFTRMGLSGKKLAAKASEVCDAIGFNCISGPFHLLNYIKTFSPEFLNENIVSVMPNAGYPTVIDNRTFFEKSSEHFSKQLVQLAELNVKILGGCCGTTPEFIRETALKLRDGIRKTVLNVKPDKEFVRPTVKKSALLEKMEKGQKIFAVEIDPPLDDDIEKFMSGAKLIREHKIDAVTIADCPLARARADSSILACKLKRELGLTPIPHMTCRDRNINATKALLLGLSAEGVNHVLTVTGDPVPTAERNEVKPMFSFNSTILAKHIMTLNETVLKNNCFTVFGALNVNARNFEYQLKHAVRKVEHGVSVFLTQPVMTEQAFENLKIAKKELDAKILCGIIPIVSYRNACFMNNEISGINVDENLIEMYNGLDRDEAEKLSVKVCTEIAVKTADYSDGYYIITPFNRTYLVCEIIENIRRSVI